MREEKTSSVDVTLIVGVVPKQYAAAIASALCLFIKAIRQNESFETSDKILYTAKYINIRPGFKLI